MIVGRALGDSTQPGQSLEGRASLSGRSGWAGPSTCWASQAGLRSLPGHAKVFESEHRGRGWGEVGRGLGRETRQRPGLRGFRMPA